MKKIFTKFFMLATLFLASTNLTAQTYNNGTWYSLYDATEYKNKDNTFSVFSPTTGSLSFQWKKTGWLFGYPIYKLSVSESSNGSNYTEKYSLNSGSGTKQENYVTVTTAVSENITHLKFKQSGSLDRFYKDIKIPLAKHILLNDGTSFGTISVEKKFANSVSINETSSEIVTVELRSFLTAGNISISSDNPAFYVATSTYAVGANACASANGAASSMAGGGTLGNINNYDVLIYFHPTSTGTHSGTITLTDGTSKATIKVSGTCTKKVQTITWNDDIANIKTTDNITLNATATTAISYTSSDNSIAEIVGNTLSIKKHGKVTITATAAETDIYASVSQTKEVTISAVVPEIRTWPKVAPITYGTPLTFDMLVGGNANVPGNFECAELPTTLNAGTHKISVRFVPENQNIYTIVEEKIDIIVNKADATITTIPNAINDLAYSGEEQILITEGSAEGGKIVYSLDGNTFTENVPTATNAGEYTVYYKVVGDENHNDVESANTIVVIIKKATLTITAEDKSVTYGEEAPTYSVAYSGWKAQDNEDVLVGEITFECEYNANSNVGTYAINISGVEAQNYEITFVSGVLIVNKADATITNTPNAINDLVYSGEEQILITEGKAEGGKIVYSLDGKTFTENVPTATNAGEYTIYYNVIGDENHNGVEDTNAIVVTIKKATLTITAEDKSVTYGEEAPTYSATYSGWKAQDNEEVLVGEITFECEYNIGSKVGTYTIYISGVEAQNYEITFVSGVLIVNKADATITNTPNAINDLVYSGEEQILITEGKAEGGKIVYSLDGKTFTENVPTATNAGEYTVYYNVVGDENHNHVTGTNPIVVTIKKAILTITAEDKSVTYGEEVPTYSVAYSGWKAQDNEEVLVGEMTFECEYNIGSKVGTYTIYISGVEAQNYEITFVSGVLTVSKAEATITTIPNAINDLVYNGEEQKLITEGEANGGKMVYSLDGNTFEENIPTATNAGEYIVYYKVLGDENHNDIEVANTIVVSIQKATQSIIWDNHIDNIYTTDNITLIAIANTDIYYTSSDSTIAYVENATLVINKYGRVTITAIAKESNNYIRATESKDITISRATPTITWTITSDTLTIGNSIRLDAVASNNAEVLYEIIGEEGILQYDNQEKTLTAMVTGTTTVLAYTEENDIYEAAEYKYTITVILDSNPSTDITNTTINGEKAQKMFINGKLYIIRDNQWYDTTGKLVK